MIELHKITYDNLEAVLELKLEDAQKDYVDSVIYSLVKAYVNITNDMKPPMIFAIYNNDEVIGFVKIGFYELTKDFFYDGMCKEFGDKATYGIDSFMIDKKHQGKGLGKQAIIKIIEFLQSFPQGKTDTISVSYWMTNIAARKLYASVGFVETGDIWDGVTFEAWNSKREDIEDAEVGARFRL